MTLIPKKTVPNPAAPKLEANILTPKEWMDLKKEEKDTEINRLAVLAVGSLFRPYHLGSMKEIDVIKTDEGVPYMKLFIGWVQDWAGQGPFTQHKRYAWEWYYEGKPFLSGQILDKVKSILKENGWNIQIEATEDSFKLGWFGRKKVINYWHYIVLTGEAEH